MACSTTLHHTLCGLLLLITGAAAANAPCKLSIIGGGPSGVYSAWRLAKANHPQYLPQQICCFERSARLGGRTYTLFEQGSRKDLTVEAGAYRFCGETEYTPGQRCNNCAMCMPMMANLIKKGLNQTTAPYEPGGGSESGLVKIVDPHTGFNSGLVTYVDAMYNESLEAGVRFYKNKHLDSLSPNASGATLDFADGTHVFSEAVILAIPLLPLHRVLRRSVGLKQYFNNRTYPSFLRVPFANRHIKLYVHYEWAWWRQLGLTSGVFSSYGPNAAGAWDGACTSGSPPLIGAPCSSDTLPLEGRYHDGDVRCDDGNQTGAQCRGFLEATYTSDGVHYPNVTFFELFEVDTDPPVQEINPATSSDAEYLLGLVHERLVAYHAEKLSAAKLTTRVLAEKPSGV